MSPLRCDECGNEIDDGERVLNLRHGRVRGGTVSYGKETLMCQSCTLREIA